MAKTSFSAVGFLFSDKLLGIDVLAEGAETKEQVDFLRNQGCQYVQAYYYSRPLPEEEYISFISSMPENQNVE